MPDVITDARQHALTASELLRNLDRLQERLQNLSTDERAHAAVTGALTHLNRNQQYTIDLAAAHAQTALALAATESADRP